MSEFVVNTSIQIALVAGIFFAAVGFVGGIMWVWNKITGRDD